MSIWFGPKGKTYAGTGENSWLKRYIEHLTGNIKQDLAAHCDGSVFQHHAEDIVYDETRTVKVALLDEAKERSRETEILQKSLEQKLEEETKERSAGDVAILEEMHSLNVKNGVGEGSLQSLHSTEETGLDGVQTGNGCHAKGDYSNAQNYGTVAASPCQSSRGKFNKPDADGVYADIVGNGEGEDKRSNAYTLDWDGNGWFLGDVTVGKEKKPLITKAEAEQKMQAAEQRISLLEASLLGKEKSVTVSADAGATFFYTVPKGYRLKSVETVTVKLAEGLYTPIDDTQVLEFSLFDSNDSSLFSGEIEEGTTELQVTYPYNGEDFLGKGFYFDLFLLDKETDDLSRIGEGIYTLTINFTLETLTEERFDILETEIANKVNQEVILTEAENHTLVLEENQDARLGETESLALSLPEHIGDRYRSTFSFQSGEKATSLAYGYMPLVWKGDDVTSDGRFVPEPFSIYEADIKNLGINGIRAKIDKIAGCASVDVEGTLLSLPSSAGKALRDYKIYGNSVQDGEPSAETPVAIQSVGDYNEETGMYEVPVTVHGKNFFNMGVIPNRSLLTWTEKGTLMTSGYACGTGKKLKELAPDLKVGERYVLYIDSDGNKIINSTGVGSWMSGDSKLITEEMLNATVNIYGKSVDQPAGTLSEIRAIQIQKEKDFTGFESYIKPVTTTISLEEPLRKVGDVADYVDFKNNCVVQQVEVLDDTGTQPIEESYATLEEPMIWGYESGFPEIKTNLYDNVITVDAEIQPSNVKVTYFKKEG